MNLPLPIIKAASEALPASFKVLLTPSVALQLSWGASQLLLRPFHLPQRPFQLPLTPSNPCAGLKRSSLPTGPLPYHYLANLTSKKPIGQRWSGVGWGIGKRERGRGRGRGAEGTAFVTVIRSPGFLAGSVGRSNTISTLTFDPKKLPRQFD